MSEETIVNGGEPVEEAATVEEATTVEVETTPSECEEVEKEVEEAVQG